jgi:GTPase SAR1 family protein
MSFFNKLNGIIGGSKDNRQKRNTEPAPKFYNICCPCCFQKFSPSDVVFRATHSEEDDESYALQEDEILNKYREKFDLDSIDEIEAVIDPKNIDMENKKYVDEVLVEVTDKYGYKTNKRLCPYCHNPIPLTFGRESGKVISVVGASQVGKTVYMTALIHMLQRESASNFNSAFLPVGTQTSKKFRELYEDRLFEQGDLLEATRKEERMEPFIYQWKDKTLTNPSVNIVFFDSPGEGMDDPDYMEKYGEYIKNSDGLLFLIDPAQIRTIRKKLEMNMGDGDGILTDMNYADPTEIIVNFQQTFIGLNKNGQTDIPTAVVLTKSDLLKHLADDDSDNAYIKSNSNVFENYTHQGKFNLSKYNNINGEISRFIDHVERPLKDAIDVSFKNTGYFAVSALGSNQSGTLEEDIQSIRCDEPFLWLLYKMHVISGGQE